MMLKFNIKMLRVLIVYFGWYLITLGTTVEHNSSTQGSILDKFQQHDYIIEFERIIALRHDERYIEYLSVATFKHNRSSAVVNASITFKQDTGLQLELIVQGYRFASNEYRLFPIHFQMNFCQAVHKNVLGQAEFRRCGTFTGCPLVKDKNYTICNWAPNATKFPPFIPNGKYMFELQAVYRSVEFFTVRGYLGILRPIPIPVH